jgi:hypothetical protein
MTAGMENATGKRDGKTRREKREEGKVVLLKTGPGERLPLRV